MVDYIVKHRKIGSKDWKTVGFHFIGKKPSIKYMKSIGIPTTKRQFKFEKLVK